MAYLIFKNFHVHGDFIQSIKTMRSVFGFGLKETKDICDAMKYNDKPYRTDNRLFQSQIRELRDCNFTVEEEIYGTIPDNLFSFGNEGRTKKITFFNGVLTIVTPDDYTFSIKLSREDVDDLAKQLQEN